MITEATSSNAHIIDARGVLVSHPVDHGVLPGVTRISVLEIAREMGLAVEERPFTPDELFAAREAFISGGGNAGAAGGRGRRQADRQWRPRNIDRRNPQPLHKLAAHRMNHSHLVQRTGPRHCAIMRKLAALAASWRWRFPAHACLAGPKDEQGKARKELRAGNVRSLREIEQKVLPTDARHAVSRPRIRSGGAWPIGSSSSAMGG